MLSLSYRRPRRFFFCLDLGFRRSLPRSSSLSDASESELSSEPLCSGMEPPERRNHALTKFGRPVSELALTTKGKREKGKVGRKPGKERKGVKERGSGDSREFGSNKRKESGASRG